MDRKRLRFRMYNHRLDKDTTLKKIQSMERVYALRNQHPHSAFQKWARSGCSYCLSSCTHDTVRNVHWAHTSCVRLTRTTNTNNQVQCCYFFLVTSCFCYYDTALKFFINSVELCASYFERLSDYFLCDVFNVASFLLGAWICFSCAAATPSGFWKEA